MASIALGVVGAGIGSIFGNPMLGFSLGMTLGGLLFPQNPARGKLDDLRVTGSSWGTSIPRVWGYTRLAGNVIWSTDLQPHASGGKGGGPSSYSYSVSCAVLLSEGTLQSVLKIWADNNTIIYDSAATPPTKHNIRIYDGTQTLPDSYMDAQQGGGVTPSYKGRPYVMLQDFDLSPYGNRMPNLNFETFSGAASVATVVRDTALLTGLTDADIDVSLIAATAITGYVMPGRDTGKSIVAPLLAAYSIDLTLVDGVIRAIPRGGDPVVTILERDLGAQDWPVSGNPQTSIETVQAQDVELPRSLDLTYFSKTGNYEQSTQQAIRTTKGDIQQSDTFNTPIVFYDDAALQAAYRILYARWRERFLHKFSLPFSYLVLIPSSPVFLPILGELKRVRITSMDIGLVGLLKLEAVEDDDAGVYCQLVAGGVTTRGTPVVEQIVPVTFHAWSGWELRDADALSPGFYVAATWPDPGDGGTIYYSPDAGVHYIQATRISQRSVFGVTTGTLADGVTANAWDTASVGVALSVTGVLTSSSQTQVENSETNAVVIGEEIAGFQNATLTSALHYTLTNFLRGRRGSPITGHLSGEQFVEVSLATTARVSVDPSLIGQTVLVKVLADGQALSDVVAQSVVIAGNHAPYATPGDILTSEAGDIDYIPLSNGDPDAPSLLFDDGRVLLLEI